MKPLRKNELIKLLDHISDSYAGDYTLVSRDLNKAIYCLHFLEKDDIPRDEVQDLSFALHTLGECFHRAHEDRRRYEHEHFRRTLERIRDILIS